MNKINRLIALSGLSCLIFQGCAAAGPLAIKVIESDHKKVQEEAEERQREIEKALAKEKEAKVLANEKKTVEEAAKFALDSLLNGDTKKAQSYSTESGTISAILLQKNKLNYFSDDKAVTNDLFQTILQDIYSEVFDKYSLSNIEIAEDKATVVVNSQGIKDLNRIERKINSQDFKDEWTQKCEKAYIEKLLYTPDSQKIESVNILKGMYKERIKAVKKEPWQGTITLIKDLEQGIWLVDSITDTNGYAIQVSL